MSFRDGTQGLTHGWANTLPLELHHSPLCCLCIAWRLLLGGDRLQIGFGKVKIKNGNSIFHIAPTLCTLLSNASLIILLLRKKSGKLSWLWYLFNHMAKWSKNMNYSTTEEKVTQIIQDIGKSKGPFYLPLEHMWIFLCSILPRLILKWIDFPKAHIGWAAQGHALCRLAGRKRLRLTFGHHADNLKINNEFFIASTRMTVSSGLEDFICNKTCLLRWHWYLFQNTK